MSQLTEELSQRSGYAPAKSSSCGSCAVNVGESERFWSIVGGAGLMAYALLGPRKSRPLSLLAGGGMLYRGLTGNCKAYEALGISTALSQTQFSDKKVSVPANQGVRVQQTIAIERPAADLYAFWRNLSNLPKVMRHLASVKETGKSTSHWVAYGPLNKSVEWDAEILSDEPNSYISWRSLPGSDVDSAGSVHFRELGTNRGTAVDVSLKYNPPGGALVAKVASLLGQGADSQIADDLRRFKALMEAGEAPTTSGQTHGSRV